jgi:hypothetical protein
MKSSFEYRSYCIENEGTLYSARPMDGDELTLRSAYLVSLMRGVDALWDAVELVAKKASTDSLPVWIKDWLKKPSSFIDLDLANGAAPFTEPARILPFPKSPLSIVTKAAAASGAALVALAPLVTDFSFVMDLYM